MLIQMSLKHSLRQLKFTLTISLKITVNKSSEELIRRTKHSKIESVKLLEDSNFYMYWDMKKKRIV